MKKILPLFFAACFFGQDVFAQNPILRLRAANANSIVAPDCGPEWKGVGGSGPKSGSSNSFNYDVNTGNISSTNINAITLGNTVPNYVPKEIFTNERWDPGALPEMEWTFDNLPNGDYLVRLYMMNGFPGTSEIGERFFDISIEGVLEADNLDLTATFGHRVGGMLEYPITLTDGVLNILFEHEPNGNNPLVNGIEILDVNGNFPPQPISVDPIADQFNVESDQVNLSVMATCGDPNLMFTYSASNLPPGIQIDPNSGIISGSFTQNVASVNGTPFNSSVTVSKGNDNVMINFNWLLFQNLQYRVNTGGSMINSGSTVWEGDTQANPSIYLKPSSDNLTFSTSLANTFNNYTGYPDALFSNERYNTSTNSNTNMKWTFPVNDGDYTVNLIFAEVWTGAQNPGVRVFDVLVEGALLAELNNFDQTALYGWNTAGVVSISTTVNDGVIDIEFIKDIENPNIKGIEILGGTPLIPAPIALADFSAKPHTEKSVMLDWITSSEENNEYFSIEHSTDGRNFTSIDMVEGALNSTVMQYYSYEHKDANKGNNYYRLRQVDTDGTFSFSPIEVVRLAGDLEIKVLPTLADRSVTISVDEAFDNDVDVEIYDVLGRLVFAQTLGRGDLQVEIPVSDFQKGHYFVRIKNNAKSRVARFIKR